ncbi:MAG: hypothetical protein AAF394_00435 [Planctomycetota bacterium]
MVFQSRVKTTLLGLAIAILANMAAFGRGNDKDLPADSKQTQLAASRHSKPSNQSKIIQSAQPFPVLDPFADLAADAIFTADYDKWSGMWINPRIEMVVTNIDTTFSNERAYHLGSIGSIDFVGNSSLSYTEDLDEGTIPPLAPGEEVTYTFFLPHHVVLEDEGFVFSIGFDFYAENNYALGFYDWP